MVAFKINSLNKGLIFHAPLNTKYQARDRQPYQNNGTPSPADLPIRNHGASFDDANASHIGVGYQPSFSIDGTRTVSLWTIARSGMSYDTPFGIARSTDEKSAFMIYFRNGYIRVWIQSDDSTYHIPEIFSYSLDTWYHIVVTWDTDGGTAKLYVNDDYKGEGTTIDSGHTFNHTTNHKLAIGRYGARTLGYWTGNISDVKYFDYILSESQITQLYKNSQSLIGNILDMPLTTETMFNDISGNGYHGTNNGVDIIGESAVFDSGDYINHGDIVRTTNITISTWVKTTTTTNSSIISKGTTTGTDSFNLRAMSTGKAEIWYNITSPLLASTTSINDDVWHFVAYSYDGVTLKLYVDGVLEASGQLSVTVTDGAAPLLIGSWDASSTWWFTGHIKDVHIFNRALSDTEISQLYSYRSNMPSISTGRLYSGLVLDMPLKSGYDSVGDEICTNGQFETDKAGWSNFNFSSTQQIGVSKFGSGAAKITSNTWDWGAFLYSIANPTSYIGKTLKVTLWCRGSSSNFDNTDYHTGYPHFDTNFDTYPWSTSNGSNMSGITEDRFRSDTWYKYETIWTVPTGVTELNLSIPLWVGKNPNALGSSFEFYVDGVSIKELHTLDITPNNNNGVVYGATVGADSTSFDGTDDSISTSLATTFTATTISFWLDWNNLGTANVEFIGESESNSKMMVHIGGSSGINGLKFDFASSSSRLEVAGIVSSGWNHYAITYNSAGAVNWYKNGALHTSGITGVETATITSWTIGTRFIPNYYLNGDLKNLKIYNRSLSPSEIKQLYNKELNQ